MVQEVSLKTTTARGACLNGHPRWDMDASSSTDGVEEPDR
jgi:hypothetical protein